MLRNKYLYIVIAIVIVIILLLKNCNGIVKEANAFEAQKPYVNPPFKNALIERTTYNIDAAQGAEIVHGTTKITIPTCAFLDSTGNVVQDSVQLGYREVLNPTQIMLSGVSMDAEEGSGNYFESAGMMEMVAYRNGEELYTNPDCMITVAMQSLKPEADYNVYSLDTTNRKWVEYESNIKPEQIKVPVSTFVEPNYAALAKKAGVINPLKPVKKNKKLYQFKFKTDFTKYPEINIYNGVQWEFAGHKASENPAKNPWVMSAYWHEMEIVKRKSNGIYVLRLVSGEKVFKTTVKAVFDEEDMEYAEYVFNQKYTEYRKFIDQKKEEARKWQLQQKRYELSRDFSREFRVNQFGWCNIDRIMKYENQLLTVDFKLKSKKHGVDRIFVLVDSMNSVIEYNAANFDKFRLIIPGKKKMVVIDSVADVYIVSNSAFEKIKPKDTQHTFKLENKIEVNSTADIQSVLKNY